MKIRDVMSADVRVCRPDDTIREAATTMIEIDAGALPVADNDRLIGMITDRDIAVRDIAQGHGADCKVSDVMTSDVVCAKDTDDVLAIAQQMSDKQVRRMPVVDAMEQLVGMVSLGDLSREQQDSAAATALEGVSAPGGQHQQ